VLALLQRIYAEGIGWSAWDFGRAAGRHPPPRRITAKVIGQVLAHEYYFARYMAEAHDPNEPKPTAKKERCEFEAREKARMEQITMMRQATGDPIDDTRQGQIDQLLQEEYSEYSPIAQALEHELGPRFIGGNVSVRAQVVRRWVRRYREQGRLPRTMPPVEIGRALSPPVLEPVGGLRPAPDHPLAESQVGSGPCFSRCDS